MTTPPIIFLEKSQQGNNLRFKERFHKNLKIIMTEIIGIKLNCRLYKNQDIIEKHFKNLCGYFLTE